MLCDNYINKTGGGENHYIDEEKGKKAVNWNQTQDDTDIEINR